MGFLAVFSFCASLVVIPPELLPACTLMSAGLVDGEHWQVSILRWQRLPPPPMVMDFPSAPFDKSQALLVAAAFAGSAATFTLHMQTLC